MLITSNTEDGLDFYGPDFFGGLTAFLLGVMLEYTSTLVQHTLGKPTFFVVARGKDELLLPFLHREAEQ